MSDRFHKSGLTKPACGFYLSKPGFEFGLLQPACSAERLFCCWGWLYLSALDPLHMHNPVAVIVVGFPWRCKGAQSVQRHGNNRSCGCRYELLVVRTPACRPICAGLSCSSAGLQFLQNPVNDSFIWSREASETCRIVSPTPGFRFDQLWRWWGLGGYNRTHLFQRFNTDLVALVLTVSALRCTSWCKESANWMSATWVLLQISWTWQEVEFRRRPRI